MKNKDIEKLKLYILIPFFIFATTHTLKKINVQSLSDSKEHDRSKSFSFDYEANGIPFGSQSKGALSLRLYSFQFERNKRKYFSVYRNYCYLKIHSR